MSNSPKNIYRSTIRTVCVVFASLFNNIYVRTYNPDGTISDKLQKVEIAFAGKEQYAYWAEQKMRLPDGNTEIGKRLPRMSFDLTGINIDANKQLAPWVHHAGIPKLSENEPIALSSYSPLACQFDIQLSVWTKDIDTSIQILDQILPFFKPDVSVKVKENYDLPIINDITIIMNSMSKIDNYEDGFDENRLIEWDIQFTISANIWQKNPDKSNIIKEVIVDFDDPSTISLIKGINYYDL